MNAPYVAPSGAARSHECPAYHLIPPTAIRREAIRWTLGAKDPTKGPHNWRKGLAEAEFIQQTVNHLVEHLMAYLDHLNEGDDNLAAIKWACSALMVMEENDIEAVRAALLPPCQKK